MLRCVARVFPVDLAYSYIIGRPFFYSAENTHAYESGQRGYVAAERRSLQVRLLVPTNMPAV